MNDRGGRRAAKLWDEKSEPVFPPPRGARDESDQVIVRELTKQGNVYRLYYPNRSNVLGLAGADGRSLEPAVGNEGGDGDALRSQNHDLNQDPTAPEAARNSGSDIRSAHEIWSAASRFRPHVHKNFGLQYFGLFACIFVLVLALYASVFEWINAKCYAWYSKRRLRRRKVAGARGGAAGNANGDADDDDEDDDD